MKTMILGVALVASLTAQAAEVTLGWDTPQIPVASHIVSWGTASRQPTNFIPVSFGSFCIVTNLVPATRYFFTVRAKSFEGAVSEDSNEIWYDVPAVPPPVIPTNSDPVIVERRFGGGGVWLPVATNYFTSTNNRVRNYRVKQGTYR